MTAITKNYTEYFKKFGDDTMVPLSEVSAITGLHETTLKIKYKNRIVQKDLFTKKQLKHINSQSYRDWLKSENLI